MCPMGWLNFLADLAVTYGNEIHFAPNAYAPHTRRGLARLAHELTHVVQQANGCLAAAGGRDRLHVDAALETQAARAGELVAQDRDADVRGLLANIRADRARSPVRARAPAPRFALQPQLVLECTAAYVLVATNALGMLTGQVPNALVFTVIPEGTNVTKGTGWPAALGMLPNTCALLGRVIDSGHWATVRNGGNATTPAMWTKDKIWAAVRGEAGFMTKVTTPGRGASCTITWDGGAAQTANYDAAQQHIVTGNVPNHITLAHELVHADRIGRGTFKTGTSRTWVVLDTRAARPNGYQNFVNNGWTYDANAAPWVGGIGGGWVMQDIMMVDDIADIGMPDRDGRTGIDGLLVTENMVRTEFGLDRRAKYGLFRSSLA